jgi:inositol transporter-like SP family MFS transporter
MSLETNERTTDDELPNEDTIPIPKANQLLIDEIFNKYGFGCFTFKIFMTCFIFHIMEGLHLTMFSSMIIPITNYYKLSKFQEKFIPGAYFLAIAFGSLSLGFLSKKIGRVRLFNFFSFLNLFCHLTMALSKNANLFFISRLIIGYSMGINLPISMNILTECSPTKGRSIILIFSFLGFNIGYVILLLIMLIVMPNLEANKTQEVLLWACIPTLISLLYNFFILCDSPRNLIINKKEEEAIKIIEKVNCKALTNEEKEKIIEESKSGINNQIKSSYYDLFSTSLMRLTLLLSAMFIIRSLNFYGLNIITSYTLKDLGVESLKKTNHEIIVNQIYISLIVFPCYFVAGPVSEIKSIGRKFTMIYSFSLSLIFIILIFIFPKFYSVWLGASFFCSNVGAGTSSSYLSEAYPTRIRDVAFGMIFFYHRFGSFISQFIYLWLYDINMWIPYIFSCIILFIFIILAYLLPFETCQASLDNHTYSRPSPLEKIQEEDEVKLITSK